MNEEAGHAGSASWNQFAGCDEVDEPSLEEAASDFSALAAGFAAFDAIGFGLTFIPERTFWNPSTMTRSPSLSPFLMTQSVPVVRPTSTERTSTLSSDFTT
jgi:hypothetical protein